MMREKRKGWKIESWNEEEKERLISQWLKRGLLLHQGCEEYIRIIVHTEQEHTQTQPHSGWHVSTYEYDLVGIRKSSSRIGNKWTLINYTIERGFKLGLGKLEPLDHQFVKLGGGGGYIQILSCIYKVLPTFAFPTTPFFIFLFNY